MKIVRKYFLQIIPLTLSSVFISLPVVAGDSTAGKAIYDGKGACATCHGATGAGDGIAAAAFNPKPTNFISGNYRLDTNGDGQSGADVDIAAVIKDGAAKFGGNVSMPGRADLTDDEVKNLIAYIHSLKQ